MSDWMEREINRPGRDSMAAEARELWNMPAAGQTRIRLTESQVNTLGRIMTAFSVYTPVCSDSGQPIALLLDDVKEFLFAELGRAEAISENAARKRAETIARRKRNRAAEAERWTTHPSSKES